MKKSIVFLGILYFLVTSCNNVNNSSGHDKTMVNKFGDTIFQQIMEYQYYRKTKELLKFTKHQSAKYREAAALAFGSVQDTNALSELSELLNDPEPEIRIATAFAIGQTGHASGFNSLYKRFSQENNNLVKNSILEAIGKCGNEKALRKILDLNINYEQGDVLAGKAMAIARFSIRGIFNDRALNEIIKLLRSGKVSEKVKYNASIALTRMKLGLTDEQCDTIIAHYKNEKSVNTKLNIVIAVGNNKSEKCRMFLSAVLNGHDDYRLKVNALRSLSAFDYQLVRDSYYSMLTDSNVNVAIRASEYFLGNGKEQDAETYSDYAKKANNWRVAANLLTAAIKYSNNKEKISEMVVGSYHASSNNYEKAWLLKALGGDLSKLDFVKNETFSTEIPIIRSSGIEALNAMRGYDKFDGYNKKYIKTQNMDLKDEFADIFKNAILSGDVAMISIASGAIRNPDFKLKNQYKDTGFLHLALKNCKLPKQIEAYLELQKAIDYINGTETAKMPEFKYKNLNWDEIAKIKADQKIEVISSKGSFIIQLNVEKNPATVAAIMGLIKNGFYKNKQIHRVVPNFVIQDGCPRGDGWGSPDFSIKSEFYNSYYEEGSFGMASAGKDTESSQWFVTHSPTPHLDGRYTMFGEVIEGMDVVHKIEVGDDIKDIIIVK